MRDRDGNNLRWEKAPGDEEPGEPTAEARWRMVLDYVDAHGPIQARYPDYLQFNRSGVELFHGASADKRSKPGR